MVVAVAEPLVLALLPSIATPLFVGSTESAEFASLRCVNVYLAVTALAALVRLAIVVSNDGADLLLLLAVEALTTETLRGLSTS